MVVVLDQLGQQGQKLLVVRVVEITSVQVDLLETPPQLLHHKDSLVVLEMMHVLVEVVVQDPLVVSLHQTLAVLGELDYHSQFPEQPPLMQVGVVAEELGTNHREMEDLLILQVAEEEMVLKDQELQEMEFMQQVAAEEVTLEIMLDLEELVVLVVQE